MTKTKGKSCLVSKPTEGKKDLTENLINPTEGRK